MQIVSKSRSFLKGEAFSHWVVLGVCLGLFFAGAILKPARPGEEMVSLGGVPIPPICLAKRATGLPCPGCGLTRSWVAAMHGKWPLSLSFHRLGWLAMLFAAAQVLRHGLWLARPGARTRIEHWGRRLDWSLLPISVLLIANWLLTLAQRTAIIS